jgi:hypothetical protein
VVCSPLFQPGNKIALALNDFAAFQNVLFSVSKLL